VHCHCLPGLDDGPPTMADAVSLCRALVRDRVAAVVATPHQLGPYGFRNSPAKVRAAVADLRAALDDAGVPLTVLPGGDVRIDERLPQLLAEDRVLTVADGGAHLLLELPGGGWVDPLPLIEPLVGSGVTPIITHPERKHEIARDPAAVAEWVAAGAALQVTAGSLLGEFGVEAEAAAWRLLEDGRVSLVASDAHGCDRRPPRLAPAMGRLRRRLGGRAATLLCVENPRRILAAAKRSPRHVPTHHDPTPAEPAGDRG